MGEPSSKQPRHHVKQTFCYSRPSYREARWERAVKVYTVSQESQYLIVQGIPAVGAQEDLVKLFALYGDIEEYNIQHEYPAEEFTEVYLIKFKRVQSARFAKKKLDNRSFFGGILHVAYAPEFESEEETRIKLAERKRSVISKIREYYSDNSTTAEQVGGVSKVQHLLNDEDGESRDPKSSGAVEVSCDRTGPQATSRPPPDHPAIAPAPFSFLPPPYVFPPPFGIPPVMPPIPPLPCYIPPYMPLPPPPTDSRPSSWHHSQTNIQPDGYEHRVRTKNESLPQHVRDAEDRNALLRAGTKRPRTGLPTKSTPLTPDAKEVIVETSEPSVEGERPCHDVGELPSENGAGSAIVWRDSESSKVKFGMHMFTRTSEPTAWDPFKEERKLAKSVTGLPSLDRTADTIANRLKKTREAKQPIITDLYDVGETVPAKLRKKTDRKRI